MPQNEAYFLTEPRKQLFYRNLNTWLTVVGLAQPPWWGYESIKLLRFSNAMLLFLSISSFLSEIAYMFANKNVITFKTLGVIFAILPVTGVVVVNVISAALKPYQNLMKKFMDKIHLLNFKKEGFVDDKMIIRVEKISRYTAWFLAVCIMFDWCSWTFSPIITNVRNIKQVKNKTKTLNSFIYLWTPYFEYEYNIQNWIIIHTVATGLGWMGCSAVVSFTSVEYIFVYHLIGHIKLLNKMITFFKQQDVTNDEEMKKKLVDVIKYHIFIKNLFEEIKAAFGLNITATYVHNLIGDSLLLYQVMFGEKESLLSYALMFILYMGSLIMLSFVLEEIKNQSDKLSIILYDIPWEDMSVRNQKIFLMLFTQVQAPMQFLGAGDLKAGVQPMISIVKSTFSYYVMLKSRVK